MYSVAVNMEEYMGKLGWKGEVLASWKVYLPNMESVIEFLDELYEGVQFGEQETFQNEKDLTFRKEILMNGHHIGVHHTWITKEEEP